MRRFIFAAVLVTALAAPATAAAAPKAGCPVSASGWEESSVQQLAADFFPHLLPGQFANVGELAGALAAYDANGDGMLCAKWMWDEELNPNANWYGVVQLLPRDNNANGG